MLDLWSKELLATASSLKYACYIYDLSSNRFYSYAKAPIGSDMYLYTHSSGSLTQATSSSQLKNTGDKFKSLSETQNVTTGTFNLISTRYKAGDLYS